MEITTQQMSCEVALEILKMTQKDYLHILTPWMGLIQELNPYVKLRKIAICNEINQPLSFFGHDSTINNISWYNLCNIMTTARNDVFMFLVNFGALNKLYHLFLVSVIDFFKTVNETSNVSNEPLDEIIDEFTDEIKKMKSLIQSINNRWVEIGMMDEYSAVFDFQWRILENSIISPMLDDAWTFGGTYMRTQSWAELPTLSDRIKTKRPTSPLTYIRDPNIMKLAPFPLIIEDSSGAIHLTQKGLNLIYDNDGDLLTYPDEYKFVTPLRSRFIQPFIAWLADQLTDDQLQYLIPFYGIIGPEMEFRLKDLLSFHQYYIEALRITSGAAEPVSPHSDKKEDQSCVRSVATLLAYNFRFNLEKVEQQHVRKKIESLLSNIKMRYPSTILHYYYPLLVKRYAPHSRTPPQTPRPKLKLLEGYLY